MAIARQRPQLEVALYDGEHLPAADGTYDLGILSHVLEHVPDPAALLREVGRACRAVVLEVPLEANLSARRASKRAGATEVGHLHELDRAAVTDMVQRAGLRIAARLDDPLPLSVHRFFAATPIARARATVKWGVRRGTAGVRPGAGPAAVHRAPRLPVHAAGRQRLTGRVAPANKVERTVPISSSGIASGSASF